MKTRVTIDLGDFERLVIAKYFAPVGEGLDKTRTRATRVQVKRFVQAAVRSTIREQAAMLRGRARGSAKRLASGAPAVGEELRPPSQKQPSLAW